MNIWDEKRTNNFCQSHTIAHLHEFRQVNYHKPETVNICLGHEMCHNISDIPNKFILLNSAK